MSVVRGSDLVVFSHLRWDFVFQRPQHLMSRYAKYRRVFYFEEPIFGDFKIPELHVRKSTEAVEVVVPHLNHGMSEDEKNNCLRRLVDELIETKEIEDYSLWYYSPMFLPISRHLNPSAILFDVMDELSLFKGAPPILIALETELLKNADIVFTGGHSIYEAKKHRHSNMHPFPSSIDYKHFSQARKNMKEPEDQKNILHPRVGFCGVIDERTNIELLGDIADLCPHMQFVMIGPVVKIDPATLPQRKNIHYLGKKDYAELPMYLSGWDCAMMPFALNDSTKYISPTKTPEYLAAGKPVVSTAIRDVVRPYGEKKLVRIAHTSEEFAAEIVEAMTEASAGSVWLKKVDEFLSDISWDITFKKMAHLEKQLPEHKAKPKTIRRAINSPLTAPLERSFSQATLANA